MNKTKEETDELKQYYLKQRRKYIESHNKMMVCPLCHKQIKEYYYNNHCKSQYHLQKSKNNELLNIIKRIEKLEELINKPIL